MRRWIVIVGLTVAAVFALAQPVAAHTFDGSCTLSGEFRFTPPLGNELRMTELDDRAAGACTGTLNGVRVDEAPATIRAKGQGTLSCRAGIGSTNGTLTFIGPAKKDVARGKKKRRKDIGIRFNTTSFGGLTQFLARFQGAESGDGIAHVTFLPYTGQASIEACQANDLQSARYDVAPRTITPMSG